jgi:hypothetical protein
MWHLRNAFAAGNAIKKQRLPGSVSLLETSDALCETALSHQIEARRALAVRTVKLVT